MSKKRPFVALSFAEAEQAALYMQTQLPDSVLCGGFAMQLYGSDRLTKDVDLAVRGAMPEGVPAESLLNVGGYSVDVGGVPVDLIYRNDDYIDLYDDAVEHGVVLNVSPAGLPTRFVSFRTARPEHLVAMKKVAMRKKDELDLYFLLANVEMREDLLKRLVYQYLGRLAWKELQQDKEIALWHKERE